MNAWRDCQFGLPIWVESSPKRNTQHMRKMHRIVPLIPAHSPEFQFWIDRYTRVRRNATNQTGDAGKDAFLMAGIIPQDPYSAHSHRHRGEAPPPRPSRGVGILASGSCGGWRSGTLPFLHSHQERFDTEIIAPVRPGLLDCRRRKYHE